MHTSVSPTIEPRIRGSAMGDRLPVSNYTLRIRVNKGSVLLTMKIRVHVHILDHLCERLKALFLLYLYKLVVKN
jgi:hypothetical protein